MSAILHVLCVLALTFIIVSAKPSKHVKATCGYESCPKADPNALNVHIVPHSHDDVGWLKTVDQYYYGSRTSIQRAGVQYIIDSVIEALLDNPERRFIQVETAFLHQWWQEQTKEKRDKLKSLVENGQLEIIGGAWSMNDEAAAHYHSLIDQFTYGLRSVQDMLGECGRPKIGWQIDPFGHSKGMANLFSEMGYEGLFFSRLDWRDKSVRMSSRTPEMLWQGSASAGDSSNLFTSVLFNHYSAPSGYCFDILCSDDPIIDDKRSTEYNYEVKVDGYADFIRRQAASYATNNIIITMGDDFNYQDATSYFKNLDKLIAGFKVFEQTFEGKPINVFYSSPSCYVKAVNEAASGASLAFPLKKDDFFPYASDFHAYWTGYFTSRPTSKRYERQAHNLLQIVKQIAALSDITEDKVAEIDELQAAVGIMQHHDAITGTEKQHVADDYARIITEAIDAGTEKISELLSKVLSSSSPIDLKLSNCLLANVSICEESTKNEFNILVYNPLSKVVNHIVRLPVDSDRFTILDSKDSHVQYQIVPSISDFEYIRDVHHSKYDMVFVAENLPAMGLKIYNIKKLPGKRVVKIRESLDSGKTRLGTGMLGFEIDEKTGHLKQITVQGFPFPVSQQLMYYEGARGDNSEFDKRASGAYIFRPSPDKPQAMPFTGPVTNYRVYKGTIVDEVHVEYAGWARQVTRVYHQHENHIEIDWLVGPINIDDKQGKEVISRFVTNVNTENGDTFFTDSNGREMIKRTRNHRATYNYTNEEPVAGNYYPITSKITLKNEEKNIQFSVLTDRAQGGTSLKDGELELMVHRRLLNDDAFGVGEALNEQQFGGGLVARGQMFLTFGDISGGEQKPSVDLEKDIAQRKLLTPWTFFVNGGDITNVQKELSLMKNGIPLNVQVLTLEPYKKSESEVLIRLEHIYEKTESTATVNIDLSDLFSTHKIISMEEMTLGGNQLFSENEKLKWIIGDDLSNRIDHAAFSDNSVKKHRIVDHSERRTHRANTITLEPMEIKTFIAKLTKN